MSARFLGIISQNISDESVIAITEATGAGLPNIPENNIEVMFAARTREIFVPMSEVVNNFSGLFKRVWAINALFLPCFLRLFSLNLLVYTKAVSVPAKKAQNMNRIIIKTILSINFL